MSTAPPLGLIPKFVRDNERAIEIIEAMHRYVRSSQPIPRTWLKELSEIESIYVPEAATTNR